MDKLSISVEPGDMAEIKTRFKYPQMNTQQQADAADPLSHSLSSRCSIRF